MPKLILFILSKDIHDYHHNILTILLFITFSFPFLHLSLDPLPNYACIVSAEFKNEDHLTKIYYNNCIRHIIYERFIQQATS